MLANTVLLKRKLAKIKFEIRLKPETIFHSQNLFFLLLITLDYNYFFFYNKIQIKFIK